MMGSGKKGTDNAKRVMNRMKEAAKGKKSEAAYGKMKKEKRATSERSVCQYQCQTQAHRGR